MTLKEKFTIWLNTNPSPSLRDIQCEIIADDFAIGFAEWFTNEKTKYSVMYGNQEERFADFERDYTTKELLQIYKKEKL